MDEQVAKTIQRISNFDDLAQFEANARRQNLLDAEMAVAIDERSAILGRALVTAKTGLDLSDLSPAEEKIVRAASTYAGVMKRKGKGTPRMFSQLANRGLLEAAEISVSKATPTLGYQALADEDRKDLSYEQIIVDHPEEFSSRALWYARRTLKLPNESATPPARSTNPDAPGDDTQGSSKTPHKNMPWSRSELILALGLYLRFRKSSVPKDSAEVKELSEFLGKLGAAQDQADAATFRNPNGVYMKMMNFRRFDPEYTAEGKVGLTRGNKLEKVVWDEFADNPALLSDAVEAIRAGTSLEPRSAEQPYWVFVCNPKKWAIDRFLDRSIEFDSWGVRPSDREKFAPGQLGIVRVGVDKRSIAERDGKPPLEPGIYALCEIVSTAFAGTGANDEFWHDGEGREPGWPTIRIRYLHTYLANPVTIERLRSERPELSPLLLNGFQGASFPISAADFREVTNLLGYDLDDLPPVAEETETTPEKLAGLEKQFLNASPEVKERVSRTIERGPVGRAVKKALGFKCQLCHALGLHPLSFAKKNGEPYVEAHHVMPVAAMQVGSLAASNIMVVCANHHRQLHYGVVSVQISELSFDIVMDGVPVKIARQAV